MSPAIDYRAENDRLRAVLKECADDLEIEINARYGNIHPSQVSRRERDMQPVTEARKLLAKPP